LDTGDLEIQRQCACRDSDPDPSRVTRLKPRDLFGHECRGPERKEQRRRGNPTHVMFGEHEGSHLQRLCHVAGETTVVFTRHNSIETVLERYTGLAANFGDNSFG
jgi:hypothetical protein